jgi:hypothetical protein
MILGIKALQIYKKFFRPFKPVEDPSMGHLDQQEIPTLYLHHIPPGDVVCLTPTRTQATIDMRPNFLQQRGNAPKASHVREVPKAL